ncbi:hypothetical protein [Streptomyces sp. NPDC058773]|uniref:hypothetical protein n=1 Tax=Streptomyces sp. NPDC058773 TaxID=3346632 RepID=UPI0036B586CB
MPGRYGFTAANPAGGHLRPLRNSDAPELDEDETGAECRLIRLSAPEVVASRRLVLFGSENDLSHSHPKGSGIPPGRVVVCRYR